MHAALHEPRSKTLLQLSPLFFTQLAKNSSQLGPGISGVGGIGSGWMVPGFVDGRAGASPRASQALSDPALQAQSRVLAQPGPGPGPMLCSPVGSVRFNGLLFA